MQPRIPPIEPPYEPETAEMLRKWMPPNSPLEPLRIFRTLTVHQELSGRMRVLGAGILGSKTIDPRERELLILRTCARAGAAYEWGVHAAAFGDAVGLSEETLDATWDKGPEAFTANDALMIRLADELHETAAVSDELWEELSVDRDHPGIVELVTTCGFYRLLSYLIQTARIESEDWARPVPSGASAA